MHAYFIKCNEVIYNEDGTIKELHCTYDPATKSGTGFNERKPNGTVHYVDAATCVPATFNVFEPLILDSVVSSENFKERINPNSWTVYEGFVEKALKDTKPLDHFQFVRVGYFTTDYDTKGDKVVFNQTVSLKSSFSK
jgi:glutaminyl-tRNA synthetase